MLDRGRGPTEALALGSSTSVGVHTPVLAGAHRRLSKGQCFLNARKLLSSKTWLKVSRNPEPGQTRITGAGGGRRGQTSGAGASAGSAPGPCFACRVWTVQGPVSGLPVWRCPRVILGSGRHAKWPFSEEGGLGPQLPELDPGFPQGHQPSPTTCQNSLGEAPAPACLLPSPTASAHGPCPLGCPRLMPAPSLCCHPKPSPTRPLCTRLCPSWAGQRRTETVVPCVPGFSLALPTTALMCRRRGLRRMFHRVVQDPPLSHPAPHSLVHSSTRSVPLLAVPLCRPRAGPPHPPSHPPEGRSWDLEQLTLERRSRKVSPEGGCPRAGSGGAATAGARPAEATEGRAGAPAKGSWDHGGGC